MIDTKELTAKLDVADRAIEVAAYSRARREAKATLDQAYKAWKQRARIERAEVNTEAWERMMEFTSDEYDALAEAQRQEQNARKRLDTAIRRAGHG